MVLLEHARAPFAPQRTGGRLRVVRRGPARRAVAAVRRDAARRASQALLAAERIFGAQGRDPRRDPRGDARGKVETPLRPLAAERGCPQERARVG